jgi:hypothetical protein
LRFPKIDGEVLSNFQIDRQGIRDAHLFISQSPLPPIRKPKSSFFIQTILFLGSPNPPYFLRNTQTFVIPPSQKDSSPRCLSARSLTATKSFDHSGMVPSAKFSKLLIQANTVSFLYDFMILFRRISRDSSC